MKTNRLVMLLLILIAVLSPITNALDIQLLKEAEELELTGEPLSAEMEYISTFEDCLSAYNEGRNKSYNLAVCEFLLRKIMVISDFTGENADPLAMIDSALQNDLPEPLKSRLILARTELLLRSGNAEDAAKESDKLNFINSLTIHLPKTDKIIELNSITPNGEIPAGTILEGTPDKEVTAYIPVEASEPVDVALRFGSSTPVELYLNSRLILKTTAKRSALPDQQAIGIHLKEGLNLLSVKLQNTPETSLYLRLTDPTGAPLNNGEVTINNGSITATTELTDIIEKTEDNSPPLAPMINTGAEQYLASLFNNDKKDSRAAYFLGYLLLHRQTLADNAQATRHLLLSAARNDPQNATYLMAIAEANDESLKFVADREENMRRMSLEKAIQVFPDNILARAELARYYLISQNSPERAMEYITQALEINPTPALPNLILHDIYKTRGWLTRAEKVAEETAQRDPQNPSVQRVLAHTLIENSTIDNSLSAFLAAYTQDSTDRSSAINIFRLLIRKGETEEAEQFAQNHLKLDPYFSQLRFELLQQLLASKTSSILDEIELARKLFPNSNKFTRLLGDYYEIIQNDKDKALTYYKEALQYDPGDLKLRKYLKFKGITTDSPLKNIPDLREYVSKVDPSRIPAGSDNVYILNEKYDRIESGGIRNHTVHLIIHILSKKGAEILKRYPIWYDKDTEKTIIETATVTHPDGSGSIAQNSIIPRSGTKGLAVINFPALDADDIIEIEYTIAQTKPNFFGSYFGTINLFANTLPILESRYILTASATKELFFNSRGNVPAPQVIESEEETTYIWSMSDLPQITLSPNSPPIRELSPSVEVSTFKDWDSLATWYWDLIKEQNQPTPEISAKVKELTLNSNTDREKLEAIYNWVTTEVRNNAWEFGVHGYKPYNAGTIFTRRFGDCKDKSTLINVMANLAGIDAWPVLIRSTQNNNQITGRGEEDFSLPLLSHFNHCLSYVELDDKPYFLDGTTTFRTIDSSPMTVTGAKAVVIRPDGAEITRTADYSGDINRWIDYTGIGINAEGTADIDFTIATTGESSMYLRAWFRNPQTWDNVFRSIATEKYGHVSAVVIEDFGNNEEMDKDEVMLKGRVRIRDYARKTQPDTITFKLPLPFLSYTENSGGAFPSELSSYAITSKRSTDLILPALYKLERHLKIEWPVNWKIAEELPEDIEIDAPFGSLSIKFEKINNILKLDYKMELKKSRITSEEYSEFRDFCFKADFPARASFTLHSSE